MGVCPPTYTKSSNAVQKELHTLFAILIVKIWIDCLCDPTRNHK